MAIGGCGIDTSRAIVDVALTPLAGRHSVILPTTTEPTGLGMRMAACRRALPIMLPAVQIVPPKVPGITSRVPVTGAVVIIVVLTAAVPMAAAVDAVGMVLIMTKRFRVPAGMAVRRRLPLMSAGRRLVEA